MLAITPGDCAAEQLRAAGVAMDVLPWQDLLHEGPVPADLGPAELARVRADHLGSLVGTDPERVHAELTERDALRAHADIEFGIDFHGRISAPMAKVMLKALEP